TMLEQPQPPAVEEEDKVAGRKDDDNAATKDASAAEPTVFDYKEVTMTMAQTLIKMKAKKARLFNEQMAKRLHDEEVEQAAAREKREKIDLEKAKVLQQQKNMIIYLKNMDGYKMEHFRVEVSGSHSTQDTPTHDPKEMSEKDVQNMLEIVPVFEFKRSSDENFHEGQSTKEQKFGYILQVIKKLELKKLDALLAEVDVVQRLEKKALRDSCCWLMFLMLAKFDNAVEVTEEITLNTNGMIKVLPLKTAEEVMAREREIKAKTTFLMALPEDHLAKFHKMADEKEMWEAIKSRFGGNDEFNKMQKYLLKQQFEAFSVFTSEGLHKGYDRFQTLLSKLKIHGAGVLHEDANQKFLRSLPSFCFDYLYNNLRVFEHDVKGTTASSSSIQNVAFVSADNTSSTNDVAMISMRIKKFHKRTGRKLQFDTKDPVGFDKTKVECFNCHKIRHFTRDCRAKGNQDSRRKDAGYKGNKARDNDRRPAYQDDSKALVTIDEEDIDWSGKVEEDAQNYAMMAHSSSNSGFDNE
nr:ribonuclease H-like domain-containing protein [Tanacetum cinerariifolium]